MLALMPPIIYFNICLTPAVPENYSYLPEDSVLNNLFLAMESLSSELLSLHGLSPWSIVVLVIGNHYFL